MDLDQQLAALSDVDSSFQYPIDKGLLNNYEQRLQKRLGHYKQLNEEGICDWPSSVADKPTSVNDCDKKPGVKTLQNRRK